MNSSVLLTMSYCVLAMLKVFFLVSILPKLWIIKQVRYCDMHTVIITGILAVSECTVESHLHVADIPQWRTPAFHSECPDCSYICISIDFNAFKSPQQQIPCYSVQS